MLQAGMFLDSFNALVEAPETLVGCQIDMKSILQTILPILVGMAQLWVVNAQEEPAGVEPGNAGSGTSAELKQVDQVRVTDGALIAVLAGESFTPTNSVAMPFGIKVTTNLTYSVNSGSERKLLEGQILTREGTLQSPDGTLVPVMDHITQKDGRVMAFKDGVMTTVSGEMQLPDGSRVFADGTYVRKSGERIRLLDGQLIKLDGTAFPATDTVLLKGGRVVVQKDGSSITLRPTQSMMMSDGTKVLGDGTVVHQDGATSKLVEGEVLKLEGVRRR